MSTIFETEANNNTTTANNGALGNSFSGSLTNADADFFKFNAATGGILKLNFTHPNGVGTAGAPIVVEVQDAAGNVVINQTLTGNAQFSSTVNTGGDYFIRIADGVTYSYTDGGIYSLTPTLANIPTTTYDGAANNIASTAVAAQLGAPISGSLNNADTDYFKFNTSTGGVLNLNFTHPNGVSTAGAPIIVEVQDAAGNVVINQTLSGNAQFSSTVNTGGDYFIRIADGVTYSYTDGGIYSLTPTLANIPTTTYDGAANNSASTAVAAQLGAPISGSLNNADTDFFKFNASSGGILKLNFTHPNGVGSAGALIVVEVLDAAGNVVINKTLTGSAQFSTTVNTGGDYFIRIADGAPYNHDDGGVYSLTPTLLNVPATTYDGAANNSASTAIAVPLGSPISGSLNNADTDFFKFNASSGGALKLNFIHPNGVGTAGTPIVVEVLDAVGNSVIKKILTGNTLLNTAIGSGGDYFMRIADGASYNHDDGGVYEITASLSNQPSDLIAPTVLTFSPADDANAVAVASNIELNFSEPIQRGAGNIVLKTGSGTVVATYDVATSGNLSISGSKLTINPSADLAYGTQYKLEFAAGTVKDLVGNSYAGSTSYNFTAVAASAKRTLTGTIANELYIGGDDDETIDGGGGIDTVKYNANHDGRLMHHADGSISLGANKLMNIERLQFADKKIALDLTPDGNAGKALEFIGMLAHGLVGTPTVIGAILSIFDQGKSMHDVCQLAIDVGLTHNLAGSAGNLDLAKLVFRNVVGTEPSTAIANELAGYLQGNGGLMTQADFLTAIAQLDLNNQHIGLVGLQNTGVEYII